VGSPPATSPKEDIVSKVKNTLISAMAIGLLAGSAVGVTAQDEGSAEPVKFTAVFPGGGRVGDPTCEVIGGMTQCTGSAWSFLVSEESDPRMAGQMTVSQNQNQWPLQPWLVTETYRIVNDDGAWQGSFHSMKDPVGWFGNATVVLVGEGANEGLYAWADVSDWDAISGVIFSAPPPEAPTPPSAD
jgi:hypothetical protein